MTLDNTPTTDDELETLFEKGIEAYDQLRNADTPSELDYGREVLAEAKTALQALMLKQALELIGEDMQNGEVVRNVAGEIKGRGAGSYYLQAQNDLKAELRAAAHKRWGK